MNRTEFLTIVNDQASRGGLAVEIGALHKPALRGPSVRYLDIFPTAYLREKYKNDPNVNTDDIVEVSYLSFDDIEDHTVEVLFSSHNIEHQPNLLDHLAQAARVLKPEGDLFLCIPDHRHCFDHHKSESSIADILAAAIEQRTTPSPLNILEHHLFGSKNRHRWDGFVDPDFNPQPSVARVKQVYERACNYKSYQDVHCWKFTPSGFEYIVQTIYEMGLTPLKLQHVYGTQLNTSEFFCHLRLPRNEPQISV